MKELPPVGSIVRVGCTYGHSNGDDSFFDNEFVYVIAHDKSGHTDVAVVKLERGMYSKFGAFPADLFEVAINE